MALFDGLWSTNLATAGVFLFFSLTLAMLAGYGFGHRSGARYVATGTKAPDVSTLITSMLGLLAFTLSLSIGFAEDRFEARRGLVVSEANAISTAWLRTKLIDGDEGAAMRPMIEAYAKVQLDFTVAPADRDLAPLLARTDALQNDIWHLTETLAHRSPNTVTTSLVNALNEMFDLSASQRFAYWSQVPRLLLRALFAGAVLTVGALGYQSGLNGKRLFILSSLLLLMWCGGILLILDLSDPRRGDIEVDAAPLIWTIQSFDKG